MQLLRYNEPNPGLFIAESPKVIERALKAGYEPLSFLVEHKIWIERQEISLRVIRKSRYTQQNMKHLSK